MPAKTKKRSGHARGTQDGGAALTQATQRIAELERDLEKATLELDEQRKERNYFQLERDKIYSLYEVSKKRLEETEAALRNKEREMEEIIDKHQVAIKVYQQKIKDLLYSSKQEATQLKTEGEEALRVEEEDNRAREAAVREEKRVLQVRLKEQSLSHMEAIKALKEENLRAITLVRTQYEERIRAAQLHFRDEVEKIQEDSEIRRKTELHELEERKNTHAATLIEQHQKALEEARTYYLGIIKANLDLIRSLKDELAEAKKRETASEKLMFDISQENKRLGQPLQKALEEVAVLRQRLADHEQTKTKLETDRARIRDLEAQLKSVNWELSVLRQRYEELEKERNDLYDRFEKSVADVQSRAEFREKLLERELLAAEQGQQYLAAIQGERAGGVSVGSNS